MNRLTDAEILEKVKTALNITGTYQDETVKTYIEAVILFMSNAGISEDVIYSSACIGVIARGVNDLWIYGEGATFSNAFMMLVSQLALRGD